MQLYTPEQREQISFEKPENWLKAKDVHAMCQEFHIKVLNTYTYSPDDGHRFQGRSVCGAERSRCDSGGR